MATGRYSELERILPGSPGRRNAELTEKTTENGPSRIGPFGFELQEKEMTTTLYPMKGKHEKEIRFQIRITFHEPQRPFYPRIHRDGRYV